MRPFLRPALCLCLLLAAPALAATATKHATVKKAAPISAPYCEFPAERAAFEIIGLKSELTVTALVCKQQEKYNAFMSRFNPDVEASRKIITLYFKRAYGKRAQTAYDEYITNLANIQQQDGLKAGNVFCDNLPAMFDEVMSLHNSTELHDFTNTKVIAQPIEFEECPMPAPAPKKVVHKKAVKKA